MIFKKLLLPLVLSLGSLPLFASGSDDNLRNVIAVQQVTISQLSTELSKVSADAREAKKVADEALAKAEAAADAASKAQTSAINADGKATNANAVAGRFYTGPTGGGRSCTAACAAQNHSCIVAFAGNAPFSTTTCDASPAGNLLCLCYTR